MTKARSNATAEAAKGDLRVGNGTNLSGILAVGNNGETLVADSSTSTGLRYQGNFAAGKNILLNANFDIWQRGTSFAAPANLAYTADRWFSIWGTANRTISRQAGFSGSQYCMRVARNSGTTDAAYSGVIQIIETNNLIDLQGQTVTLSFSARRGANYSAASNAMIVYLQCGTAADQGSSVYWSPGWTGLTSPIVSNVTLSTTEQTFSLQAAIPANCQEIAITFQYL